MYLLLATELLYLYHVYQCSYIHLFKSRLKTFIKKNVILIFDRNLVIDKFVDIHSY